MPDITELEAFLAPATVADEVFALRPDYRALLIAVDGLEPGAGDTESEALLTRAEEWAAEATASTRVEDLPHIASWRDAFRGFGAKPQRTRRQRGLPARLPNLRASALVGRPGRRGGSDRRSRRCIGPHRDHRLAQNPMIKTRCRAGIGR